MKLFFLFLGMSLHFIVACEINSVDHKMAFLNNLFEFHLFLKPQLPYKYAQTLLVT